MNTLPHPSEHKPTASIEAATWPSTRELGDKQALLKRLSDDALGSAESRHAVDTKDIDARRDERYIISQQIGGFTIDTINGNEYTSDMYHGLIARGAFLQKMKAEAIENSTQDNVTLGG